MALQQRIMGYLLHKNPAGVQTFELGFGQVHVYYPKADEQECQICVLLDVDPVGLVRGRGTQGLDQYVNDRPYVASSFLSVSDEQVVLNRHEWTKQGTARTRRSPH